MSSSITVLLWQHPDICLSVCILLLLLLLLFVTLCVTYATTRINFLHVYFYICNLVIAAYLSLVITGNCSFSNVLLQCSSYRNISVLQMLFSVDKWTSSTKLTQFACKKRQHSIVYCSTVRIVDLC